eukprot:TRINITY_DN3593_c0_g1_i1.p1 TRINITY_DN3593_c0_g1~~TRINITY_DN3593_c0_g1_i1.p1  ORF type:complete len:244 (+),score=44.63 TRINITY_DN3593_c0_g1_i1:62-793(+)
MEVNLSRRMIERQYPDIVRSRVYGKSSSTNLRTTISSMTQTEETTEGTSISLPSSLPLVKSVEERRAPLRISGTPPYRKRLEENYFASSVLASSPLIPRLSVLHANTSFSRRGGHHETPQYTHSIVVAIDFGTAYSGYAYSFTRDPENIHIMRKWEGDDPGMNNQKTPTILLLTPEKKFHSFGTCARDTYHDLEPLEAKRWFFFDKFKMLLHHNKVNKCPSFLFNKVHKYIFSVFRKLDGSQW